MAKKTIKSQTHKGFDKVASAVVILFVSDEKCDSLAVLGIWGWWCWM